MSVFRKIQNVLGYLRGNQEPEKFVLVSNHYDAWTYGAVDPNSGTTTLLEVSRALKEYQNKTGWVPGNWKLPFFNWTLESLQQGLFCLHIGTLKNMV